MMYSITEAKEQVIRAGIELVKSGLIARTWGNISARISETQFVITPSGKAYDSLTPDDIVTVNIDDGKKAEGENSTAKPSSEKGVHAAAYRLRPDVGFVIHTHQNDATALSVLGRQFHIDRVRPGVKKVLGPFIPTAKYGLSSTKKLERNIEFSIRKYPQARSILMRNHGTLCMGCDDQDTFRIARTLEEVCRMKYRQMTGSLYPSDADTDVLSSECTSLMHRQIHEEYDRHYLTFENSKINCIAETKAPFIMAMSTFGKNMRVFVDDLAQMAGTVIKCLPEQASEKQIAHALSGSCGAVLIEGHGAVCAAGSEDDVQALVMVLDKGCRAALLDQALRTAGDKRSAKRVSKAGGALEHVIYKTKYAKLKDAEDESC